MIAHISKPLHAGSEASKCTPTISILTPPLSSGLFLPHYHHEWRMGRRKHKPSSFPIKCFPKCHASYEMRAQSQWCACALYMCTMSVSRLAGHLRVEPVNTLLMWVGAAEHAGGNKQTGMDLQ